MSGAYATLAELLLAAVVVAPIPTFTELLRRGVPGN